MYYRLTWNAPPYQEGDDSSAKTDDESTLSATEGVSGFRSDYELDEVAEPEYDEREEDNGYGDYQL